MDYAEERTSIVCVSTVFLSRIVGCWLAVRYAALQEQPKLCIYLDIWLFFARRSYSTQWAAL